MLAFSLPSQTNNTVEDGLVAGCEMRPVLGHGRVEVSQMLKEAPLRLSVRGYGSERQKMNASWPDNGGWPIGQRESPRALFGVSGKSDFAESRKPRPLGWIVTDACCDERLRDGTQASNAAIYAMLRAQLIYRRGQFIAAASASRSWVAPADGLPIQRYSPNPLVSNGAPLVALQSVTTMWRRWSVAHSFQQPCQ